MSTSAPELEGYLYKSSKKALRSRWRRKWFVLREVGRSGRFVLEYYGSENKKKLDGQINLESHVQIKALVNCEPLKDGYRFAFDVKTKDKQYSLVAASESDMNRWISRIYQVCGLKKERNDHENENRTTGTPESLTRDPVYLVYPTSISGLPTEQQLRLSGHSQHLSLVPSSPNSSDSALSSRSKSSKESPYVFLSRCISKAPFSVIHPPNDNRAHDVHECTPPIRKSVERQPSIPDEAAPPPPDGDDDLYKKPPSCVVYEPRRHSVDPPFLVLGSIKGSKNFSKSPASTYDTLPSQFDARSRQNSTDDAADADNKYDRVPSSRRVDSLEKPRKLSLSEDGGNRISAPTYDAVRSNKTSLLGTTKSISTRRPTKPADKVPVNMICAEFEKVSLSEMPIYDRVPSEPRGERFCAVGVDSADYTGSSTSLYDSPGPRPRIFVSTSVKSQDIVEEVLVSPPMIDRNTKPAIGFESELLSDRGKEGTWKLPKSPRIGSPPDSASMFSDPIKSQKQSEKPSSVFFNSSKSQTMKPEKIRKTTSQDDMGIGSETPTESMSRRYTGTSTMPRQQKKFTPEYIDVAFPTEKSEMKTPVQVHKTTSVPPAAQKNGTLKKQASVESAVLGATEYRQIDLCKTQALHATKKNHESSTRAEHP